MTTLLIRDELSNGQVVNELSLDFLEETVSVRELIRSRVYEEVRLFNFSKPGCFKGLIQPSDAEAVLNGYKLREKRAIDWQQQYEVALEAFQKNSFLVLVDDRQVEDLDHVVELKPGTQVSFLKLVQLVGG